MTSRQSHKRRGKGFETDLAKTLREMGYDVERLALAGSLDEGDLRVKTENKTYILEAKAPGESGRIDLSGWIKEAQVETVHYGQARNIPLENLQPVVVIKARGKSIREAYVVMKLSDLFPEE